MGIHGAGTVNVSTRDIYRLWKKKKKKKRQETKKKKKKKKENKQGIQMGIHGAGTVNGRFGEKFVGIRHPGFSAILLFRSLVNVRENGCERGT